MQNVIEDNERAQRWVEVRKHINQGLFEEAYNKASSLINQSSPPQMIIDFIQVLLKLSKFTDTELWIQHLLEKKNYNKEAYLLLGHLYFKKKDWDLAKKFYNKNIAIDPSNLHARYNLGLIASIHEDFDTACKVFESCLELSKHFPGSFYQNYGMALIYTQEIDKAKVLLTQAAQIITCDPEIFFHLGLCYHLSGQLDLAFNYYQMALNLDKSHCPSLHNIAIVAMNNNQTQEALSRLNDLLKIKPNDIIVKTLIDALGKRESRCHHPVFIKTLFDQYAFNYDNHLTQTLKYNPFKHSRDLLCSKINMDKWNCGLTLDLGCGTGLAAPYFVDLSYKTIGVDLSEGMLIQAKKKNFFDELHQEDIFDFLEKDKRVFQLILAFEISNYLGKKVSSLVKALENKMLPSGVLIMTFEKNEQNYDDIYLNNKVRFSFSYDFIDEIFSRKKFKVLKIEEASLRREEDREVEGFIAVVQKIA